MSDYISIIATGGVALLGAMERVQITKVYVQILNFAK